MTNLIYIHIGKTLPRYIYDSIYQSLLISIDTKIYVILDETLIHEFNQKINTFNISIYTNNKITFNIQPIPLSILTLPYEYTNLIDNLPLNIKTFRNSFWIHTIARFFYIEAFMKLFKIEKSFHIENDIMIYEDLNIIEDILDQSSMYMVKDNEVRVIASIIYLNLHELQNLLKHLLTQLELNNTLNDMQLLGMYKNNNVKYFPFDYKLDSKYIFDGCALGQFLGGIDPRNIHEFSSKTPIQQKLLTFNNPTINFINETSTFKPTSVGFFNKENYLDNIIIPLNFYYTQQIHAQTINIKQITNLHIHSKQLYQFSSVFNIKYNDIITGERIMQLCDFILTIPEIFDYHKNLESFVKLEQIIIVKDFQKININALNSYFKDYSLQNHKKIIKIFIYTHLLDSFVKYVLPHLEKTLNYILYLHNSDHRLNQENYDILNTNENITKVFSQNINCSFNSDKFQLLPIGLANSMFEHGDILTLYDTMSQNYYKSKIKNLYININPKTFYYRQQILDELNNDDTFNLTSTPKPFNEYLHELSQHRFSLCIRGNGLDTHRFTESLYLGVIPVIINNKYTNMDNHITYLKNLGLPFYEIKEETLEKYSDDFFNEILYKKIIKKYNSSIYNLPQLTLKYYSL